MAFSNMWNEILGAIPGMNTGLAKTKLNEAFQLIQDEQVWSFQVQTGGWLSPGLLGGQTNTSFLSPGVISIQPFSDQMTGDAIATAAWYSAQNPPITVYQIRVPYYDLYSIVAINGNGTIAYATIFTAGSGQTPGVYTYPVLDNGGPGTGGSISITVDATGVVSAPPATLTAGSGYLNPYIAFSEGGIPATFTVTQIAVLTLDRLWTSPAQSGSGYMAYQAYFPYPAGYRRTYAIRDLINNLPMDWSTFTQASLAEVDPQRTDFSNPEFVVYYSPDTRVGSATYGQELAELWQHPLTQLSYNCQWQVLWPPLVNPNDTVPFPLTEEVLKFRAMELCCLWKEVMKGDDMERGSGANWQFLAGAYRKEYDARIKTIRVKDRNICDLYFQKFNRVPFNTEPFASVNGQLSVGF